MLLKNHQLLHIMKIHLLAEKKAHLVNLLPFSKHREKALSPHTGKETIHVSQIQLHSANSLVN